MVSQSGCPKCHGTMPVGAQFCPTCGEKLYAPDKPPMAQTDPLIGQLIENRFLIQDRLGEGGMGVVYLAEQTSVGRQVALKVLNPHFGADENVCQRFRNEAALASRLNHPNTVIIYDFGMTRDQALFIAMELVNGTDLDCVIKQQGSLDWQRVCRIGMQICGSLQNAHDQGIVHRDLKPENIMLTSRGSEADVVKVLDFGIAKITSTDSGQPRDGLTRPNEIFGTPEYMAPEQVEGQQVSNRTDIYSLGAILYRLLTGSLPFAADTQMAMLVKHLTATPRSFAETNPEACVPGEVEALVMHTLAKQPQQRPDSMSELADRLRALLNHQTAADSQSMATQPEAKPPTQPEAKPPVVEKHQAAMDGAGAPTDQEGAGGEGNPTGSTVGTAKPADTEDRVKPEEPDTDEKRAVAQGQTAAEQPDDVEATTEAEQPAEADERSDIGEEPVPKKQALFERLLKEMKKQRDFPTVSQHISELNTKAARDTTSASQLANVILKDHSLTTKLLRLVNSPYYGGASGRIATISRAVVMMGFEAVKQAALGMMMFDHLQSRDNKRANTLKDAAIGSLMSGLVAKSLASRDERLNAEEAFVCAMFHNLGKNIAQFYFAKEVKEAKQLSSKQGIDEPEAIQKVLGVTYVELGRFLAKKWNLPEQISETMSALPADKLSQPKGDRGRLHHVTGFANELTEVTSITVPGARKRAIKKLAGRFHDSIKISDEQMDKLFSETTEQLQEYAKAMNLNLGHSKLVSNMLQLTGQRPSDLDFAVASPVSPARGARSDETGPAVAEETVTEAIEERRQIMAEGAQHIAAALNSRYDLNSLMIGVLETMYRGLELNRVIFCLNDVNVGTFRARSGFGESIDEIIPRFSFSSKGGTDLFSQSLSKGQDIVVNDSKHRAFKSKLPKWYIEAVDAPMFLLYPVRVRQFPAALFYGDFTRPNVMVAQRLLTQMKILRDQAAKAIEASHRR